VTSIDTENRLKYNEETGNGAESQVGGRKNPKIRGR